MNKFVSFLRNSHIFENEKLDKKVYLIVKEKIESEKIPEDRKREIVTNFINSGEIMKNFIIINYPFHYIDIKIKCVDKKYLIYSLSEYFDSIYNKEKKNFDYFILKFDNTRESQFKQNPLKILKSKIKYNGKVFLLTSVLYKSGDNLKIKYRNIWDLTDEEYEIRQEYFILNGKILSSKDVLDTYEKHNGDDEYIRENDYNNRIAYCLYEKYDEKTDQDFIKKEEIPEVDKKYSRFNDVYNIGIQIARENPFDLNKIIYHILKPPSDVYPRCGISTI